MLWLRFTCSVVLDTETPAAIWFDVSKPEDLVEARKASGSPIRAEEGGTTMSKDNVTRLEVPWISFRPVRERFVLTR